jgi:hypothetical protein
VARRRAATSRGSRAWAGGIVLQGAATGADTIRIHPASAFTLQLGGERLAYRGDLLVHRKGSKLVLVNEVDLETYVAGVIVNEIGDAQAPAAYRAQSVVARSYAYSRWRAGPDAMFHVYDTQSSQVYRGVSLPARAAVTYGDLEKRTAETRGVILTWRGESFPTYYARAAATRPSPSPPSSIPAAPRSRSASLRLLHHVEVLRLSETVPCRSSSTP